MKLLIPGWLYLYAGRDYMRDGWAAHLILLPSPELMGRHEQGLLVLAAFAFSAGIVRGRLWTESYSDVGEIARRRADVRAA